MDVCLSQLSYSLDRACPPLGKRAILCSRKVRAALTFHGLWNEPPDSLRTALLLLPCGRVQELMCCIVEQDRQATEAYLVCAGRKNASLFNLKGR